MKSEPQSDTLIEFGRFGFDKALGKLSKQGATIRLSGLPLKILQRLLERPGEIVSRAGSGQNTFTATVPPGSRCSRQRASVAIRSPDVRLCWKALNGIAIKP